MTDAKPGDNNTSPGLWAGIFLCSIFLITQFNFSVLSPVIPSIADSFSLSGESARLMVSYGFTGYMMGQLVWGPLSDRINRSSVVIVNLGLYSALTLSAIVMPDGKALIANYIAMGFLAATFTSVGNAILKDRYQGEDYVIMVANVGVVMAAGPAIGPGLTAVVVALSQGAWQVAFMLMALTSLISLSGFALCSRYSPKARSSVRGKTSVRGASLFRNGRYFAALLSFSLPFGILISYLAVGPYLLKQYFGVSDQLFPIAFFLTTVVYLFGAIVFRGRSGIMTPTAALRLGTFIALVGAGSLLLLAVFGHQDAGPGIIALCFLLGGTGMVIPAGKAATMGQVATAFGTAASVMKFVQSGCAVAVSAWASLLFSAQHIAPLFVLYTGVTLLACLSAFVLHHWSKPSASSE
ncbi:MAG: MFS transporter [Pseudomonadota bacterium]